MASKQQADQEFDPKYEWQENSANFLLRVHLSGFRKEDFRVQVDGAGRLTVRGQRADGGKHIRFHKVFQLPPTSNLDDISGRFDAGVLNITVPKRPAPPPATIEDIIGKPTTTTTTKQPKEEKVDDEAKKAEQAIKQKPAEEKNIQATRKPEEDKQEMEEAKKKKKTADERAKEERKPDQEQHKTTMTPPAVRKEEGEPKQIQGPTTDTKPPPQAADRDRDSLLERVRRRAEEERAKAAEEAERQKKQGGWNWKELPEIKASEWAEGALNTVKKNKEVVAAAVAAFSLGLFVSSRIFARK